MTTPGPFGDGVKSLLHWQIILVAAMATGLTFLAHRSQTSLADAAFASSIAVLVFLLPAAALVGPYLVSETADAVKLLTEAHREQDIEYLRQSVNKLVERAEPLRRAFVYTTLAVLISALALVEPTWKIGGLAVTETLGATAIALLVNTALCVFPMTWELMQMNAAKALLAVVLAPISPASQPGQPEPMEEPEPPAGPELVVPTPASPAPPPQPTGPAVAEAENDAATS